VSIKTHVGVFFLGLPLWLDVVLHSTKWEGDAPEIEITGVWVGSTPAHDFLAELEPGQVTRLNACVLEALNRRAPSRLTLRRAAQ
jgi:hypothetical protein